MSKIYLLEGTVEDKKKIEEKNGKFVVYVDAEYDKSGLYNLKKTGKDMEFKSKIIPIITKRLENIRQSGFLIVILNSHQVKEETMAKIMYSYQLGKPVYLIYGGKLEDLNDWVLNFSRGIYKSLDTLLADLK